MDRLFEPFELFGIDLANRIVMAPMTRSRAMHDIADASVALYYAQRATAGMIVTEGTSISAEGKGYLFNPGIFTLKQIDGWRLTTSSVHAVGGRIFAQIWHVGRISHPSVQRDGQDPVSATSRIATGATAYGYDDEGQPGIVPVTKPRSLKTREVVRVVEDFATAAGNAIEAGFDGVEIHGANGYLIEQFLNPLVNDRTDRYGATNMDNRLRFVLEVVDAVVARVGSQRVGIRLSPYGQLFDMPHYSDIAETYATLAKELGSRCLSYVHIMDQSGFTNTSGTTEKPTSELILELLRSIRPLLPRTALILAGGMTLDRARSLIGDGTIDLAAFGKPFISNPDLVARLRHGWPLASNDPTTFYGGDHRGYIDYPPHSRYLG